MCELIEALGEPRSTLDGHRWGQWERGVRNPGSYYAPRLCLLFDVSPEFLGLRPTPRAAVKALDGQLLALS